MFELGMLTPLLIFIGAFCVLLLYGRIAQGVITRKQQAGLDALRARMERLPIAEAEALALPIIADPEKYLATAAPLIADVSLAGLAPDLRALFTTYERITSVDNEFRVSRAFLQPLAAHPAFVKIGEESGCASHECTLVVKPGESTLYFVGGREKFPLWAATSLYHYYLLLDGLFEEES